MTDRRWWGCVTLAFGLFGLAALTGWFVPLALAFVPALCAARFVR
jgi:hypothetical protein